MPASPLLLALLLTVPLPARRAPAARQASEPVPLQAETVEASAPKEPNWHLVIAPAAVLYPEYVADPRRTSFALTMVDTRETEIDEASDRRYALRMGSRFGILQLVPHDESGGGLQLAGEIGILAQFDRENSTDNLGWDGLYGFHLAWQAQEDLVVRVGMAHDSSHLGDELIENTGRQRIEYTREEWLVGAHYAPLESARGYAEFGKAFSLSNDDLMEEDRVQLGLVLESEEDRAAKRVAPFAALDVSAYEEDDWEENWTVQLGLARFGAGRGLPWRFGVEYYDGRSTIGEFFQDRERHYAWGLWFDL